MKSQDFQEILQQCHMTQLLNVISISELSPVLHLQIYSDVSPANTDI